MDEEVEGAEEEDEDGVGGVTSFGASGCLVSTFSASCATSTGASDDSANNASIAEAEISSPSSAKIAIEDPTGTAFDPSPTCYQLRLQMK